MISSEMTKLTLPLYSRDRKRQYGEVRVGINILKGKVRMYVHIMATVDNYWNKFLI